MAIKTVATVYMVCEFFIFSFCLLGQRTPSRANGRIAARGIGYPPDIGPVGVHDMDFPMFRGRAIRFEHDARAVRRPSRVMVEEVVAGQLADIGSIIIHQEYFKGGSAPGIPIARRNRIGDLTSVRRPTWEPFIGSCVGQLEFVSTVGIACIYFVIA